MATIAENEQYWSDVQDGNAAASLGAPLAPQNQGNISGVMGGELDTIRDTATTDRQGAMDFAEQYKVEPGKAQMLSDRLSGVLEKDSPYIQRARTKANEAAGSRGLLNSSMAAGAAEGAAIDRGLDVARGDVDVDKFNVGAQTDADTLRYQAGQEIGGRTQDFQNQLGGAESEYLFDVGLAEEKQKDALETQQLDFEGQQALQDSAHGQQMETDMLQFTNERAMEMLKQQSGLYAAYLESYGQIAMADISAADKNNQLEKLGQQINNAVIATEAYQDIQITGGNLTNFTIEGMGPGSTEFSSTDPATSDDIIAIYNDLNPDRVLESWEIEQWVASGQSVAGIYQQLSEQGTI